MDLRDIDHVAHEPFEIHIEYNTKTSYHVRHNPDEYKKHFATVSATLQKKFHCPVIPNPGADHNWRQLWRVDKKTQYPRYGSFDLTLVSDAYGTRRIFSKLETGKWPNIPMLLRRILVIIREHGHVQPSLSSIMSQSSFGWEGVPADYLPEATRASADLRASPNCEDLGAQTAIEQDVAGLSSLGPSFQAVEYSLNQGHHLLSGDDAKVKNFAQDRVKECMDSATLSSWASPGMMPAQTLTAEGTERMWTWRKSLSYGLQRGNAEQMLQGAQTGNAQTGGGPEGQPMSSRFVEHRQRVIGPAR